MLLSALLSVRLLLSVRGWKARPAWWLLGLLGGSLGCSSESAPGTPDAGGAVACTKSFAGDPDQPIAVVPGAVVAGDFAELEDGSPLPLETPPQGGHVSFVGARAANLDPCGVKLKATLRSRTSGEIAAEEERKVAFAVDGPDGSVEPLLADITNAANVPLCPDYFAENIVDVPYDLEVRVIDRAGRTATATRMVVPRCQQAAPAELALCRCECSAEYFPGRCAHLLDGGWLPVEASAGGRMD